MRKKETVVLNQLELDLLSKYKQLEAMKARPVKSVGVSDKEKQK
jgi:hypothetical protein